MNAQAVLSEYDTRGLRARLDEFPARIRAARLRVAEARLALRDAENDRGTAEAILAQSIAAELDDRGKPRHSNAEARTAELAIRRTVDEDYQIAARAVRKTEWALAEAQGELDVLLDGFKAVRYVTRLMTQELALLAESDEDETAGGGVAPGSGGDPNDDEEVF